MRSHRIIDYLLQAPTRTIIGLIGIYQITLSPDKGYLPRVFGKQRDVCVFFPTCSEYAKEALEKHGLWKGAYLSGWRILRCHPWQKKHIDPVP